MGKYSRLSYSLLLATLLAACGDDSVSEAKLISDGDSKLSSEKAESSSSVKSQNKSSSSGKVDGSSSSTDSADVDIEGLDVIYVLVDGTVSGSVALESFDKSAQVKMVLLDSSENFKRTGSSYAGDIAKDGSYEIKKIDLQQPYVLFTAEGKFENVVDGKAESTQLWTLADASSGELFNLNLLTSLESERTLNLLVNAKMLYDEAKQRAVQDVWNVFHVDADGFDEVERIKVFEAGETATALLGASVLLQAGADGDFQKFFKSLVGDIAKNGVWDDSVTRLAVADWALGTDLEDGYASIRKTLGKKMDKVPGFEMYLRNFYLAELGFPACDEDAVGKVFFVRNKGSVYYAARYDDLSHSKERFVCNEKFSWASIPDSLKDFMGEVPLAKDGDVRQGAFSGDFFVYDGTSKTWRKATAIEKDKYFVLNSKATEFVDIQDVYEGIKDDERVIFVLRHAERGDDTSKSGTLTSNGKKQSEDVGKRLTKFKEDFVLGGSEFLRAHQTVESIAKGRGQQSDVRDTIPQLNDDWYVKDADAVEKAKNECGGGWEVTSKYAYTGAYSTGADAAYYDLAERSVELIEDVLLKKYPTEKFVLLSSHDKLMVPLVAYCSNFNIELKKYESNGKWINYLAGVAIIIDKSGNRRYVAVRGLTSGFAN